MDNLLERLRDQVVAGHTIFVLGAGVARALQPAAPTWSELLESALSEATSHGNTPQAWGDPIRQMIESGQVDLWVSAAQLISKRLIDAGEYQPWLQRTVGSLTPTQDGMELAQLLKATRAPLFTTNYDTMLESATSLPSLTKPGEILQLARGEIEGVGHLHGIWTDASSTIFGVTDYAQRFHDGSPMRAIEEALSILSNIIFVGARGTLQDPNFTGLLDWAGTAIPDRRVKHYALCLDSERPTYDSSNVHAIAYGSCYEDLAPTIRGWEREGGDRFSRRQVSSLLRNHFRRLAIQESLLGAQRDTAEQDTMAVSDVLIPPVIREVTEGESLLLEETLENKKGRHASTLIDPTILANELEGNLTIIVSRDQQGLTSAINWVLHEYLSQHVDEYAFACDFPILPQPGALYTAASHFFADAGCPSADRKRPFAEAKVVALDNFSTTQKPKLLEHIMPRLQEGGKGYILGVKEVHAQHAFEYFKKLNIPVRIVYLSNLRKAHVDELASLVLPQDSGDLPNAASILRRKSVLETALRLADREGLPRGAFQMTLLMSALIRRPSLAEATESGLLFDFVSAIVDRSLSIEDSPYTVRTLDEHRLFAELAGEMARRRRGDLTREEAIAFLSAIIQEYSWDDNPGDVLNWLLSLGVIREQRSVIYFALPSFMYVYTARLMDRDSDLKDLILADVFYYDQVIGHYASLFGDEPRVVEAVIGMLRTVNKTQGIGLSENAGTDHWERRAIDLSESENSDTGEGVIEPLPHDDLDDQLALFDGADHQGRSTEKFSKHGQDTPQGDDELLYVMLTLASKVLRDSEAIKNPEMKLESLEEVLSGWARFMEIAGEDASLWFAFGQALTNAGISDEDVDGLLDKLREVLPGYFVFGGMAMELATPRLRVTLAALREVELSPVVACVAAMLALLIRGEGWITAVERAYGETTDAPKLRSRVLTPIVLGAYTRGSLKDKDGEAVERLLARISVGAGTTREEKVLRERYVQELRKKRLQHTRKLGEGTGLLPLD